jgi:hypothetical protein
MEGDAGSWDAAVVEEPGELGPIAKHERRREHVCCLTSAPSGRDVHEYRVTAGVIERRPGGDRKTTLWRESAPHLAEGVDAFGEVHERELTDHDVEARILERKRRRIAMAPFDLRLSPRRDRQHPLVQIEADNMTLSPHSPTGLAGEHARPAADIENSVTRPDCRGVGNRAGPSAKDRRHETGLVDLGGFRRDLPAFGLGHGNRSSTEEGSS